HSLSLSHYPRTTEIHPLPSTTLFRSADAPHKRAIGSRRCRGRRRGNQWPTAEGGHRPENLSRRPRRAHRTGPQSICELRLFYDRDRKSTRLNSSHVKISYAVFCLKKK